MACCRRNSLVLASPREERWQAKPDGEVVFGRVDWVIFGLLPPKDPKALRVILSDGEESHKCIALPLLVYCRRHQWVTTAAASHRPTV